MSDITEHSAIELVELRKQLCNITAIVDRIIISNLRASNKMKLDAAILGGAYSPIKASVAQEVRDILRVAGVHGITCREVTSMLSQKRDAPYNTVRMALNRMRDAGQAYRTGRRWYAA